jgi:6-carboxyhexanoate--CoA ligase
MNETNLYSIRMRASVAGRHISGAERIVPYDKINSILQELASRANSRSYLPDQVVMKIEALNSILIKRLTALDLVTVNVTDMSSGRSAASRVLQSAGVTAHAVEMALSYLSNGASPSQGNMRGAMILDAQTGERLEPDHERGVRVSHFDWTEEAAAKIQKQLAGIGLTHFRTREALSLATKVAYAPSMAAELCWSDEPDYVAGYVASRTFGYVRFPILKQNDDPRGGRVFFVKTDNLDLAGVIKYLQRDAVLISDTGECCPTMTPEEYFDGRKTGGKDAVCSNKICRH